jgi:glyoxylase-like metal-dependent hydrolase (beta-lactamase superfamily II)
VAQEGIDVRISIWLIAAALAVTSLGHAQSAPVQVKATLLGGSVYGIDGQGGRMAALVGPDGILLVDAQSPAVTDRIVAALRQISPAPLRFLVNTHVHADHTGGNENFGKLGVTILGRPNLLEQLVHPVPATNGQIPPPSPASALPVILFDSPVTINLDGETVQLIPLPPSHTNGDTATADFDARVGGLPAFINVFVDALYKELKAESR